MKNTFNFNEHYQNTKMFALISNYSLLPSIQLVLCGNVSPRTRGGRAATEGRARIWHALAHNIPTNFDIIRVYIICV